MAPPAQSEPPASLAAKIVCPLCALMCDDVVVDKHSGKLSATNCGIVDHFEVSQARGELESIHRLPTDRPLRVVTMGTDLMTSRRLAQWQANGLIQLTIETDPSIAAMLETVSRDGIVSATLADVRSHSDSIGFFGNVESAYPRIGEKLGLDRFAPETVKRWPQVTAEALAEQFVELASASPEPLNQSKYVAVLVGPGAFVEGEEEITAGMITRWVRQRNETIRAVCVTMDPAVTLRSVCLWTNNQSPDSNVNHPYDLRIGSAMNERSTPAKFQVGGTDPGPQLAKAYVPVSVAGIHHRSMMIRGDGSVSLPLLGVQASELKTTLQILEPVIG